jgi:HNH endonuclease
MGGKCVGFCTIDGCDRPVKARKLCSLHYERWKFNRPMLAPRGYQSLNKQGWIMQGYRWISIGNGIEVLEHRYRMELHLGRKLAVDECVHHKDGNKLNNALNNLEVIDRAAHTSLHRPKRQPCRICGADDPHQSHGLCAKHWLKQQYWERKRRAAETTGV